MVLDYELAWHVKNSPNFRTIHWRSNKGDTREFIPLLKSIKNKIRSVIADGAYHSEKNFEYCDKNNIIPRI
jgi:hypothetical protein